MAKRTFRRKREQLLRLKTEDEEAYNIILSQGCPDYYGLPSFDDTNLDIEEHDLGMFATLRLDNGKTILINPHYITTMEFQLIEENPWRNPETERILRESQERIIRKGLSEIDDDL